DRDGDPITQLVPMDLDLELHPGHFTSVTPRWGRVPGGGIGDRVIVVGGNRAAHPDGADDPLADDQRYRALAEDEPVVAERGDVVGGELALAEPLFEIERRRAERRRRVGLRAGDLGRHPERAVHPIAGDQMPGVVDDGDRHLEAERLRPSDAALDALTSLSQAERHVTAPRPRSRRSRRSRGTWAPGRRAGA